MPEATECLVRIGVSAGLLRLPCRAWVHIRTTNPTEPTFATARLRIEKTRGGVWRNTVLPLVLKLMVSAQKRWHLLNGPKHIADVIEGVQFTDEINVTKKAA